MMSENAADTDKDTSRVAQGQMLNATSGNVEHEADKVDTESPPPSPDIRESETKEVVEDKPSDPPVEKRFNEFNKESYERILEKELERKRKTEVKRDGDEEGRLVDGEIVFDDVEDESEKITADPKLADGQPLPEKLGRFPKELDGVPLEEIDPHIEEKVGFNF